MDTIQVPIPLVFDLRQCVVAVSIKLDFLIRVSDDNNSYLKVGYYG